MPIAVPILRHLAMRPLVFGDDGGRYPSVILDVVSLAFRPFAYEDITFRGGFPALPALGYGRYFLRFVNPPTRMHVRGEELCQDAYVLIAQVYLVFCALECELNSFLRVDFLGLVGVILQVVVQNDFGSRDHSGTFQNGGMSGNSS